jgi:hypothetical protein
VSTSKDPELPLTSSVSTGDPVSASDGTTATAPSDAGARKATVSGSPCVSSASLTETMTGIGTGVTLNVETTARWSEVHGSNPSSTPLPPSSPTSRLSSVTEGPAAYT